MSVMDSQQKLDRGVGGWRELHVYPVFLGGFWESF